MAGIIGFLILLFGLLLLLFDYVIDGDCSLVNIILAILGCGLFIASLAINRFDEPVRYEDFRVEASVTGKYNDQCLVVYWTENNQLKQATVKADAVTIDNTCEEYIEVVKKETSFWDISETKVSVHLKDIDNFNYINIIENTTE